MQVRQYCSLRVALLSVIALVGAAAPMAAQTSADLDGGRIYVSRATLQALLESYEQAAETAAYSSELRTRARGEAALLRTRLAEGDFRVGDQITLVVLDEAELSKTYTLQPGPILEFPAMGQLSLRGVLRSEVDSVIIQHLSRYIRHPQVRASSTIRLSVLGEVSSPGFLAVDSGMLFTDLLGAAGGATNNADLRRIRIERGRDRIWDGEPLNSAIIEGRTLDELSLQAGDRIVVPPRPGRDGLGAWALRAVGGAVVVTLLRQVF
jgi:polysaccharide biosynthesis/export protein